jgi:predicted nuclease of predicted toxin-antitoxin system
VKLLLDQGLPLTSASLLREAGYDAVHTSELRMATASDEEILKRAASEDRIVFTLDADFHALLALSGKEKPSAVRIRIEGLRAKDLSEIIQHLLELHAEDLRAGAVISVTENRIRLRRLPL